jgi:hypothetical protein
VIGRRVTSSWHGVTGTVTRWEPLGAGLTDTLVCESSGREVWIASSDLRPVDGGPPLPSRSDERERARLEAVGQLERIRAAHIAEFHRPWPGCEFAKAWVGRMIDGALEELTGGVRKK